MTATIRGMFLKFSESVWGKLKTQAARQAWARSRQAHYKAEDHVFRQRLIKMGAPDDLARVAWERGSRAEAIEVLKEHSGWVKYYHLEEEVKAAFKKRTSK